MRLVVGVVAGLRALMSSRAVSFLVRACAILSMSFAAAFGFLAAMASP
jgi:hypothetical protein